MTPNSERPTHWRRRLKIATILSAGAAGFLTATSSGHSPEKAIIMGLGASLAALMVLATIYILT